MEEHPQQQDAKYDGASGSSGLVTAGVSGGGGAPEVDLLGLMVEETDEIRMSSSANSRDSISKGEFQSGTFCYSVCRGGLGGVFLAIDKVSPLPRDFLGCFLFARTITYAGCYCLRAGHGFALTRTRGRRLCFRGNSAIKYIWLNEINLCFE